MSSNGNPLQIRHLLAAGAVLTALCWNGPAAGEDRLDVEQELSLPGVKLVVVEYYATWCKPCMEAVPKWKDLQWKYGSRGLRFIVVSAEGNNTCSKTPDWTPDKTLCDPEGKLQDSFGVKQLPQSFVFSWQGNLSMTSHEVEPVEEAIKNYFKNNQLMIVVDNVEVIGDRYAITSNPETLRKYIIGKLTEYSKFDVVSAAYTTVPKGSAATCDKEFPPNSNLRITVQGNERGERRLTLALEKDGCIKASVTEAYGGTKGAEDMTSLENAAATGVKKLVDQLVSQFARVKNASLAGAAEPRVAYAPPLKIQSPTSPAGQDMDDLSAMLVGVTAAQWPYRFSKTQLKKLKFINAHFDQQDLAVAEHMKERGFTEDEYVRAYEASKSRGVKNKNAVNSLATLAYLNVSIDDFGEKDAQKPTAYYNSEVGGGKGLRIAGITLLSIGLPLMVIGYSMMSLSPSLETATGIGSMAAGTLGLALWLPIGLPIYLVGDYKIKHGVPEGTLENSPKNDLDRYKRAELIENRESGFKLGLLPYFNGQSGGLAVGGTF